MSSNFSASCVETAAAWIDDAYFDLGRAYREFEEESYSWAAFMAATAAEKSLKAVIYLFHETPKRMHRHDIPFYFDRAVAEAPELESINHAVSVFETYSSYVRYIDNTDISMPRDRYGKKEASKALEAADQILPAAKSVIDKAAEILRHHTEK